MTRKDYWLGVLVVAGAIVFHGMFPRYSAAMSDRWIVNLDRWTGHATALDATGSCDAVQQVERIAVR